MWVVEATNVRVEQGRRGCLSFPLPVTEKGATANVGEPCSESPLKMVLARGPQILRALKKI